MAHPAAGAPRCPACGTFAVWHAQLGQWGCDRCRQMLPPPGMAPQAQPAPMPPAPMPPAPMPPMAMPHATPPPGPPCPRCQGAATWYAAANTWGCDRCQLPVAFPAQMVAVQQGSDAGTIVLKVVGFIVLVIVVVVVKLAIRGALR